MCFLSCTKISLRAGHCQSLSHLPCCLHCSSVQAWLLSEAQDVFCEGDHTTQIVLVLLYAVIALFSYISCTKIASNALWLCSEMCSASQIPGHHCPMHCVSYVWSHSQSSCGGSTGILPSHMSLAGSRLSFSRVAVSSVSEQIILPVQWSDSLVYAVLWSLAA